MMLPDPTVQGTATGHDRTLAGWQEKSLLRSIMWVYLAAVVCGLMIFALHKTVFYYDGTENLYTAKALVEGGPVSVARTPFLPLAYSVFFLVPHPFSATTIMTFLACSGVALALVWAYFSWGLFKSTFGPTLSLFLALLLVSNRIVLHYAPSILADVPASLMVLIAFFCYLKGIKRGSLWSVGLAALLLGASTMIRYNMVIFVGIFAVACVLRTVLDHPKETLLDAAKLWATRRPQTLLVLLVVPVVTATAIQFTFSYLLTHSIGGAFSLVYQRIYLKLSDSLTARFADVPHEYGAYLLAICGLPVLVLFLFGVWSSLRSRLNTDLEILLIPTLFIILMSLVTHKEARYLLPVLPFLYFLVGRGYCALREMVGGTRVAGPLGAVVVLACSLSTGTIVAAEARVLAEPLYTDDFFERVYSYVREESKGSQVYHVGNFYALYPKTYPSSFHFVRHDEYYHFFHLFPHSFVLHEAAESVIVPPVYVQHHLPLDPFVHDALSALGPDALIIYGTPYYEYSTQPLHYDYPLMIARLRAEELVRTEGDFTSPNFVLRTDDEKGIYQVEKASFPFELYLGKADRLRRVGLVVDPETVYVSTDRGEMKMALTVDLLPLSEGSYLVAAYQEIKRFYRYGAVGTEGAENTTVGPTTLY